MNEFVKKIYFHALLGIKRGGKKDNKGVTLLELIVAVALFTALMLAATGIFKMVIDGQRNAISAQNVQENMRYVLEKMSKEMRMATVSDTACDAAAINKVFNTANNGAKLYFKNKDGNCVAYYLENNRLKIEVGVGAEAVADYITPSKILVSNLKFYAVDDLIGAEASVQPYVAMMMDAKASGLAAQEQRMKIQVAVSSRYYEGGQSAPACVPDCAGKVCGNDGCGGSCGSCDFDESCVAGACVQNPVSPTNLAMSHTTRSKSFTVSWTAGINNGGAGGCKLQFYTGSIWADITSATSVNCDANSSAVAYNLNADGWKVNWNGTQVRLVRISDSVVMGMFPQTLACAATSGSAAATPTIDEDCNGYWDNAVQGSCAQYGDYGYWRYYTDPLCTNLAGYSDEPAWCAPTCEAGCIIQYSIYKMFIYQGTWCMSYNLIYY